MAKNPRDSVKQMMRNAGYDPTGMDWREMLDFMAINGIGGGGEGGSGSGLRIDKDLESRVLDFGAYDVFVRVIGESKGDEYTDIFGGVDNLSLMSVFTAINIPRDLSTRELLIDIDDWDGYLQTPVHIEVAKEGDEQGNIFDLEYADRPHRVSFLCSLTNLAFRVDPFSYEVTDKYED